MKKVLILSLIFFTACSTSPTGRKQIIVLPDSQMNAMGLQSFQQMKKDVPIENDPRINVYVKCVAGAIAREAEGQTNIKDWEIVVFKDNTANAFALPGGKIGVHTGILPVARTAGQLAAVLGHEVGHVIARHGSERVSQGLVASTGMAALDAVSKTNPNHGALMAALGLGTQYGVLLPFSRTHESEADIIGEDLMARAGFDPKESIDLWHNMKAASGGKAPPQWLSTHPSNDTRIQQLQDHLSQSENLYAQAKSQGKEPNCIY